MNKELRDCRFSSSLSWFNRIRAGAVQLGYRVHVTVKSALRWEFEREDSPLVVFYPRSHKLVVQHSRFNVDVSRSFKPCSVLAVLKRIAEGGVR